MDLRAMSGLPLSIDAQGKLRVDSEVVVEEYRTRVLDELTPVYLDPHACRGSRWLMKCSTAYKPARTFPS